MTAMLLTILLSAFVAAEPSPAATPATRPTFVNPIFKQESPDPWVVRHDGFYYLTCTFEPAGGVWVVKSRSLVDIEQGDRRKIWSVGKAGEPTGEVWAPELYRFVENGEARWYCYFTAVMGDKAKHHLYVLKSKADDATGEYGPPVRLNPDDESWTIDANVLTLADGRRFLLYSDGSLRIAPMPTPTGIDLAGAVQIAKPTLAWERNWIEGPEALVHDGRVFVAYSAGDTATPNYSLGLLSLKPGGDPLDPAAWTKDDAPVLTPNFNEYGGVYTTGHNGFTTSPDGRENWILYHAKTWTTQGQPGIEGRQTYAQPFTFDAGGKPVFAPASPAGQPVTRPSGD